VSAKPSTGLDLYNDAAEDAAAAVIARYSTSFGMACRLLGPRVRAHVRNVYALVRIADEVVDGPALEAGLSAADALSALDRLETETMEAIASGFSTNLVVHAFATTARACGIGADLVRPFFVSMRTDLSTSPHDAVSHDEYVYGSAEVVGLMCLQVFVNAGRRRLVTPSPALVEGARRLGAAFQEINFLRDHEFDAGTLGRDYLALEGVEDRAALLDRIDADLATARAIMRDLPADSRPAVCAAHDLFAALAARLRRAPADGERVRVPDLVKAAIAARAVLRLPARRQRIQAAVAG
jgi:phytoene/squalene synthetase